MAEVSGENLDTFALYLAPERLRTDRERKIKGGAGSVLGSKNIFERVRGKMTLHLKVPASKGDFRMQSPFQAATISRP